MNPTREDLDRLALEVIGTTPEQFCEKSGIPLDAMASLLEASSVSTILKIVRGDQDLEGMIHDVAGNSFLLGWFARDQWGKPKKES